MEQYGKQLEYHFRRVGSMANDFQMTDFNSGMKRSNSIIDRQTIKVIRVIYHPILTRGPESVVIELMFLLTHLGKYLDDCKLEQSHVCTIGVQGVKGRRLTEGVGNDNIPREHVVQIEASTGDRP